MQHPKIQARLATKAALPPIPSKLYFTIGEVAKLCEVKNHVLRYWEQEFTQLSPTKRRGNRRYYQRNDIVLVREIQELLYNQGFTIEGAKAQLAQKSGTPTPAAPTTRDTEWVIGELEALLSELG